MRFICFIALFCTSLVYSQNSVSSFESYFKKGDSLSKKKSYHEALQLYKNALVIALDAKLLDESALAYKKIGIIYYRKKEYVSSESAYHKSLRLDSLSKNAADVYYNLFLIKRKLNQQDSVLTYLNRSIQLYKSHKYDYSSYNTFLTAGIIYKNRQLYNKAIEHLIIAYKGFEKLENTKKMAAVSTTMGNVHYRLKNYKQALNQHYQSLTLEKKLQNKKGISRTYINIGNVYDDLQQQDSAIKNFKSALVYLKPKSKLYAKTVGNLGLFYKQNNKLDLAKKHLELAVSTNTFLKDTTALLYNYNGLSSLYLKQHSLEKAQKYLTKIPSLLNANSDQLAELDYYQNKVQYLEKTSNYKKALAYQLKYSRLYEKIYNIKQTEIVQNIQAKFDQEKKENEILKLKLSNKNNQLLLAEKNKAIDRKNLFLIALLSIVLLIFILFYFFSQKQKVTQQQLKIEKLEAIYESQETIKKRIARDLHDIITTNFDGLRLKILALKKAQNPNELIDEVTNEIKNINGQIRTVSHRLSPLEKQITTQKFTNIIKARLSEFQLYSNIFVELENQLPEELNDIEISTKNNFYGIVLEILNNVEKHSHASKLVIKNWNDTNNIHFTFTDNGIGISEKNTSGIGLLNIQQRCELIEGSFEIKKIASGTEAHIHFPLNSKV